MWQQPAERTVYPALCRALAVDGVVVALVEYSNLHAPWPQQLDDLRRALPIIAKEASSLGGDPQRLILAGDGLGAFLASQLLYAQGQQPWLPQTIARMVAWLAVDGLWAAESIQHLANRHPLRLLFPEAHQWQEQLHLPCFGSLPFSCMLVYAGQRVSSGATAPALQATEALAQRLLSAGAQLTLIPRPEEGRGMWRGISRREHPLRISWRMWFAQIK